MFGLRSGLGLRSHVASGLWGSQVRASRSFFGSTRCFLRRLLRLAGTTSVIMWKNRLDVLLTIGEAVLFVSAVGSALFVAALAFDLFC